MRLVLIVYELIGRKYADFGGGTQGLAAFSQQTGQWRVPLSARHPDAATPDSLSRIAINFYQLFVMEMGEPYRIDIQTLNLEPLTLKLYALISYLI